jgi:PAS domain S-box-containing protein
MEELILRISEKSFDAEILWASEHMAELCGFDPVGKKLSDVFEKDMAQQPCDTGFAFAIYKGEDYLLKYIDMGISEGHVVSVCKASGDESEQSPILNGSFNKSYVQDILDFQSNQVILTDGIALRNCNKSMLEYFGYDTLADFLLDHKCICEFFLEEEGYFSDKDPGWVKRGYDQYRMDQDIKVRMYDITDDVVRTFLMEPNRFSGSKSDFIVSFTDITDVENAHKALADMNKTLFDRTSIAILKLDEEGNVSEFNEKALKLLEYEEDELKGLCGLELISETKLSSAYGSNESFDCKVIKKSGELFDALVSFEHIDFIDETQVYVFINDISKLKDMEKRNIDQERMMIQQSKMATLGEMVALIAHQWQQPLNSIAMVAQMLEELIDSDEGTIKLVEKTVSSIMDQVGFMSSTVNDFRNFLKPSSSSTNFNIVKTVKEVIDLYRPQLKYYKIQCDTYVEDERLNFATYKGFENEFKNVLLNFLTNSRDALDDKGVASPVIEITIHGEGDDVTVSIEDNAGGMPDDVLKNIFSPYVTTKGDKGTGLGLYMAKLIIEDRMNGKVRVENTNMGAKVSITMKNSQC